MIDYEWESFRKFPWMTEPAWEAASKIKVEIKCWLKESGGNPLLPRLLLHAVLFRATPLVKALLEAGASAQYQPYDNAIAGLKSGFFPLMFAVSHSEYDYDPALVDLLLEYGAEFNEPQEDSFSCKSLMGHAINDPKAVADLLRRGVDPDQIAVVKNPREKDFPLRCFFETPLQLACQDQFEDGVAEWKKRKSVRLLLEAGADIEICHSKSLNQTPFLMSIINNPILSGILLSHGANIHALDKEGVGIDGFIESMKDAQELKRLYKPFKQRLARIREKEMETNTSMPKKNARKIVRL